MPCATACGGRRVLAMRSGDGVPPASEGVMLPDRRDGVDIVGTHVAPRTDQAHRVMADA